MKESDMNRMLKTIACCLQLVGLFALVLSAVVAPGIALAQSSGPNCVSVVTCDNGCKNRKENQCGGTGGCLINPNIMCGVCICQPPPSYPESGPYCFCYE